MHGNSRVGIDPTNRIWGIHAIEIKGEAGQLDVHCSLRNLPGIRFDDERIWKERKEVTIRGLKVPTVSDEYNLLITTVGLAADVQTGHHNLRKFWTIYMMLRGLDATMDWDSFFDRRRDEGTFGMILNTFALCLRFLDAESDCPRLAASMAAKDNSIFIRAPRDAWIIFARSRQHIANRLVFARMLPVTLANYGFHWLLTLPVRLLYYR